jgi:serine phosphatase RsbU (regulator of sigma subunit)
MVRPLQRPGAWAIAAGALVPLLPGAVIAGFALGEGTGAALLLAAVAAGCALGGLTAGVAAGVLATAAFSRFVVPAADPAPHLVGFVVAAGAVVAVYWTVHSRARRYTASTERARDAAESRADLLAERVRLLGPMLDTAPIGFALMDHDLRFRYANGRFAEFTRTPAADHLGRTPAALFGPEIGRTAEEVVAKVFETGETQGSIVVPVEWPHGTRHYLSNRYPVSDADGRVIGVGVGAIDITEQVVLQEEHRRALAELTATVRSAPVAMALLGTDLTFHQANRPFQELAGDPDRPLVGTGLDEATGLPPVVRSMAVEVQASGRGAAVSDVPLWGDGVSFANVNCFPVLVDDGTVVAVALIVIDVSEQHRLARLEAEAQALRATAELAGKLEQAQRLARMGSWEVDLRSGEVTGSAQMAAIVGDPAAFLAGTGSFVVHPVDVDRMGREFRRLRNGGAPFAGEFRIVRPDGTVLDVYGTGEVIRDDTDTPVRLWGTLQDVTVQRAQERAADAAIRSADLARAELEAEHRALQMFVQAMLPSSLPRAPETEIVAAYLPVVERVDIGGDWFDSFPLPDGRFALAVGDVTGHDLRAATIMGQVRNAVRAYAFEDPSPGEVLRRVNLLLTRVSDLDLVTMVYGVYDPVRHELTWANGGHPAPLLRHRGEVVELDAPAGLILGVFADDVHYAECTVRLVPGDTVLVYTDGLVDHRAGDPEQAMHTLVNLLATGAGAPDRLLREVTGRMLAGGVQEDDVCLLALHRTAEAVPGQPLATHDLAHPGAVVPPPAEPLPGPVAWAA